MKSNNVDKIELLEIPKITDPRGNLSVVEEGFLPYEVKRVYYLYDVPSGEYRGAHAHKEQSEFLIALSGSFEVILNDGENKKSIVLNKPNRGLLIPTGIWRELENFSSGSVCLVLSSGKFLESDYIRDYDEYLKYKK
ncbi:WxcM-like domain-containing protein [Aequorivita sp. H23M31]|uniref:WxcM-like domain-containing protein n=1 Tax=Aequorivita ciconiae TaxID=2494375 RepID=A0A410G6R6_9FLAO|nr:FdtA/QdtA family cupin domain-containing protein [Aequorivita sp. H23M31]QAA82911.1 WxcM-like domain-containing protein [Aequorivita sp. H23M31]